MEKRKLKKYLFIVLKVALFVLMSYLIYKQLLSKSGSINFVEEFKKGFQWNRIPYLLIILLFVPLNWALESIKWRTFVKYFQEEFTFKQAVRSVILGSFFAFITPNRIGEFGGRLYGIQKENRAKAFAAGYWGGVAQLFITFSVGVYFGWQMLLHYLPIDIATKWFLPLLAMISLGIFILFFQMRRFIVLVQKFPLLKRFTKKYQFDFEVDKSSLFAVLFLTISRYTVYVTQYCIALYFFGIDLSFLDLFAAISTMLLLHTVIPSLPFVDLGVKGNVLMLILAAFTSNSIAILLAILLIWLLNIVSPALAGYILLAKSKLKKSQT